MATISEPRPIANRAAIAGLHSGDRMSQTEFHQLYLQTPEDFRAELIEGIVYVASPVGYNHSLFHSAATAILVNYAAKTPLVFPMNCGSTILGEESEVQPDAALRVEAKAGGQSAIEGDYVVGAPELVIEIAYSSRAIDLHSKREAYRKAGVREYLVLCGREGELAVHDFSSSQFVVQKEGVFRSIVFPGLWIDVAALLASDLKRINEVLEQGLASPEHAEFVKQLAVKD